MPVVQQPRGTRAALDALAAADGIIPGQVYVISDEARLAVGLTVSTYETYAKQSEAGGGAAPVFLSGTTSGAATLTLPYADILATELIVTLNGLRQAPTTHYTVSGVTLTWVSTPPAGMVYLVTGTGNYSIEGDNLSALIANAIPDPWFFGG